MPDVNPTIMQWARETAGLSVGEAAGKLKLRPARGLTAEERVRALETGNEQPTRPMLVKMAAAYRRPLLTFYLAEPPRVAERGQDFRTLPDPDPGDEAVLDALIRDVRARQTMVRSVLEDDDDVQPLPFIGAMGVDDGVDAVRESIVRVLGVSLDDYRRCRDLASGFALLRDAAESAGIFVLLAGDLGSYHTALDPRVFRGFALSDDLAPFVVINPNDGKAALTFTLVHELAHLWLGVTGVSSSGEPRLGVERFCNEAASTFLLPDGELAELELSEGQHVEAMAEAIADFARDRKVSASMVAYRLYARGRVGQRAWRGLRDRYHDLWQEHRGRERAAARGRSGGPSFYTLRRFQVGRALADLVRRNLREGALTTTEAGKVLGVRAKSVDGVLA